MPLLDHFHSPIGDETGWESFHANWAVRLADDLSQRVPGEYRVAEYARHGPSLEIDVATFQGATPRSSTSSSGSAAILQAPAYSPPAPELMLPAVFPDTFEIRVFRTRGGRTLVAAIELVSPSNKDRPAERRAFAGKCASYLVEGISLIVIDIVTERRANLHNETMRLLDAPTTFDFPPEASLYAVAYSPVRREDRDEIDLWRRTLAIGATLPTLPLRLSGDLFVPVDFEATYQEACRRRHIA
jgi:hypothetical protein